MNYISVQEASKKWNISKRRIQILCSSNRIHGAKRMGNMWIIPNDAIKPEDARYNKAKKKNEKQNISKQARNAFKYLVRKIFELEQENNKDDKTIKNGIIYNYSKEMLKKLGILNIDICAFYNIKEEQKLCDNSIEIIKNTINNWEGYLDNSLSWIYQYMNEYDVKNPYQKTQFFTEKYMISSLMEQTQGTYKNVLDPACGGGNFLLALLEQKLNKIDKNISKRATLEKINQFLNNIYGYDVDACLAKIAVFNMKLKALYEMSERFQLEEKDFNSIFPNIYYPKKSSFIGFLDRDAKKQIIINANTKKESTLLDILSVDLVLTNPPFETVKGMNKDLKEYLEKHYYGYNCDVCNIFMKRIIEILPENGKAGIVSQNGWMYLSSAKAIRNDMLLNTKIKSIVNLGSNAFYDLSGEKANVSLISFEKNKISKNHKIEMYDLRNDKLIKETGNSLHNAKPIFINQEKNLNDSDLLQNPINAGVKTVKYLTFATPMQGTSTGDAKNLIDYFWRHQNDKEWILVSKGGGYSRFAGLNHYVVKWGERGEYIKKTKGSALRNIKYFDQTDLVYSDTGTAGLNVRIKRKGQIFVASGPGIRILVGDPFAHLAFLNSRFASYYIKKITPKLTIAAGYIGEIPTTKSIISSTLLSTKAKEILKCKNSRLSRRINNIEFYLEKNENINNYRYYAKKWFKKDLEDEWLQLKCEDIIDKEINKRLKISSKDQKAINEEIGYRKIYGKTLINKENVNELFGKSLNIDGTIKRTKAKLGILGSDGPIEFLSLQTNNSCESIYRHIQTQYEIVEDIYVNMYLHALIVNNLRNIDKATIELKELLSKSKVKQEIKIEISEWIKYKFNDVHKDTFFNKQIYMFDTKTNKFILIK